jgi:hypothetical protein
MSAETVISDYRSVADIAQQAIIELKRQLRLQYVGSADETQKHFEAYAFELMLAYHYADKPYIFTVDFALGIAEQKHRASVSIGCGWVLADFLLSPLDIAGFEFSHAVWTAVYVIEEIKKFDGRCGGPIRTALIQWSDNLNVALIGSDKWMNETLPAVRIFSDGSRAEWKNKVDAAVKDFLRDKKGDVGAQEPLE